MNATTLKNSARLAILFALRMLGLFIILPVFALHAQNLNGGTDLFWVGFALGAFGLTQVLFQIPYGMASDIFGRKPLIFIGLILFLLGSFLGFLSKDILTLTLARALQGAGAFSGVVTALATDITPEEDLTKTMAMIGSSIALMFALSLVLSPVLYGFIGLNGIFFVVFLFSFFSFFILKKLPNPPPSSTVNLKKISKVKMFQSILKNKDLNLLNLGIFLLSLIQTSFFIFIPTRLVLIDLPAFTHWRAYLPAIFGAFLVMIPFILYAEKKGKLSLVFRFAIFLLFFPILGLYFSDFHFWNTVFYLFLFFVSFNVLEALLPSGVAKIAPPDLKGLAMGIYNTAQSAGIFCGGILGGWLAKHWGNFAILELCFCVCILWLFLTKNQNFLNKS